MPVGTTSGARRRWLAALAAGAAAAGVVACASTLEGLGTFPCALDKTCPDGWNCVRDACVSASGDGPDAGPAQRDCEYHTDCNNGGLLGACLAVIGGGSVCRAKCQGTENFECPGGDCKLLLSGEKGTSALVPACTEAGGVKEDGPCASVNSCTYGYTCAAEKHSTSSFRCTKICTPWKVSCSSGKQCTYGMNGYPDRWGLCYPQ